MDSGGGDDDGGGGGEQEGGGGGLFGEDVFQRDIVPQIVRLFGVHDATVRGILLTHLPSYVSLVSHDVLAEDVVSWREREFEVDYHGKQTKLWIKARQ